MRAILLASATATILKGRDVGRKTRFWVMRSRPARSDSEFLYYSLRIAGGARVWHGLFRYGAFLAARRRRPSISRSKEQSATRRKGSAAQKAIKKERHCVSSSTALSGQAQFYERQDRAQLKSGLCQG